MLCTISLFSRRKYDKVEISTVSEKSGEKSKNEVEKMEKSPKSTLKYTEDGEKSMEKSGEKWRKVEKSGEMPS